MITNPAVIRKIMRFYGGVQGVGFRWRAIQAARAAGVTGWVCNRYDGSVSMEIQGTEEQIDAVIQMISRSPYIQIRKTHSRRIPVSEDERDFVVRDSEWGE